MADAHAKLRLGISACLMGQEVRYDAGHKRDPFLVETLGRWVEWVPVCPEVEIGLGVPRPTMRLEGKGEAKPRLVVHATQEDLTDRMTRWSQRRARDLGGESLDGYVLKSGSPSCGMERVRVYGAKGPPRKEGVGVFARALAERMPLLPTEEEGRLHDPGLRENFIERVFAHHRWRVLRSGRPRARDLVDFHARHKMTLLAHHPKGYRELGRLVARAGSGPLAPVLDAYGQGFMQALRHRATRRRHTNVLQHLMGHLKHVLDTGDRRELTEVIERYRNGLLPLIVPVTLLFHHFRRHPVPWVNEQTYLDPYPAELMLRNHV
ncbi:MAG: YbgA family protein [Myxococcota bacterium]